MISSLMSRHVQRLSRRGAIIIAAAAMTVASTATAFAQAPTQLRINLVLNNQDAHYPIWERFARDLEAASEGTLKVGLYPSEALGKAVDVIDGISRGAPIMQHSDPSQYGDYAPDYAVFMAPYLFKKPSDIERAWNSDVGRELDAALQKRGLRVVTLGYFGERHLLSNREVRIRADTAGMKIRNAPSKMWNEVSRVLGGNPTNTAWSEAYSALEQGVADAVESPLSLLYSSKLFETRKRISLTGHLVATTGLVMSQQVYDRLPQAAQRALDTVGRAFPGVYEPQSLAIEKAFRERLSAAGILFNEVDRSSFLEAAATVPANFPEWSPGLYERVLEAIR